MARTINNKTETKMSDDNELEDDGSKAPEVRAYVVTIMSSAGTFLPIAGADVRAPAKVAHDLADAKRKYLEEENGKRKIRPGSWREPILTGDPENGEGVVMITDPTLVVAITTPIDLDEEFDDDEDEGETEAETPKKRTLKVT